MKGEGEKPLFRSSSSLLPGNTFPSQVRLNAVAGSQAESARGWRTRDDLGVPACGEGSPTPGSPDCGEGTRFTWDPSIFRPDQPLVSSYSGEIFSTDGKLLIIKSPRRPGIGFKKGDCGTWVRKLKSGDQVKDVFHNCGNLSCPVCAQGTITAKAQRIAARFDLYEDAKNAEKAILIPGEIRNVDSRHFPFTITPAHQAELVQKVIRTRGFFDHDTYKAIFFEEFSQALKLSGLVGGVCFYHDARVRHPDTGNTGARAKHLITLEAKLAGNMDDESSAWMLYDHINKQKNWSDYYYLASHVHVIAHGRVLDVSEFEEKMPGWTYHNKGYVKNVGGLARYLITHIPLLDHHKSVSWFGRLSSKNLGKEELRTYSHEAICDQTQLPWTIIESTIPEEVGSTVWVTETQYRAFFRGRTKHGPKKFRLPMLPDPELDPDDKVPEGSITMGLWLDEFRSNHYHDL